MKPETPNASHATPHFWREMQMKTHQARQVDLSRLRRSRPNKARSAHQEVDLQQVYSGTYRKGIENTQCPDVYRDEVNKGNIST